MKTTNILLIIGLALIIMSFLTSPTTSIWLVGIAIWLSVIGRIEQADKAQAIVVNDTFPIAEFKAKK